VQPERPAVVRTFRDLVVWQRAFALCSTVYTCSRYLPVEERFGLSAELRKTARSIAYNIAEGHRRRSTREYVRFLDIARGSAAELETQLLLTETLGYLDAPFTGELLTKLDEIERMLAVLMSRLRARIDERRRPATRER